MSYVGSNHEQSGQNTLMFKSRFVQAYVVPIGVYLSISIAGGYGTGREVVEFYTRHGAYGGLYGLALTAVGIAVLTALTFEFARQVNAYDYRTFFKELIGPFWIAFEILYLCLLLLVLGVVGSAAGAMVAEHTAIPESIGLLIMLGLVAGLIFYGRDLVEKVMVFLTLFLYCAFLSYFIVVFLDSWGQITLELGKSSPPSQTDWIVSAAKFTLYSSAAAVFALFATRGIRTRTEALVSGALCGIFLMLPGLLIHVSFLGALPEVVTQKVPIHWMIVKLGNDKLLPIYLLAMLGTFLGTGSGFIQALNERLDGWSMDRFGKILSPAAHSGVAIVGLSISALFGQLGVIALIAKGYGTIAWGFLFVFVLPVLFIATYKIFLRKPPETTG